MPYKISILKKLIPVCLVFLSLQAELLKEWTLKKSSKENIIINGTVSYDAGFSGEINSALLFNGYDTFADIKYDSSWLLPKQFSIEFNIKMKSIKIHGIILKNNAFLVRTDKAGKLMFALWNNGNWGPVLVSAESLLTDKWHHIIISYDGIKARIFIDDRACGEKDLNGNFEKTDTPFVLGKFSTHFMHALFCNLKIYNHAINPVKKSSSAVSEIKTAAAGQQQQVIMLSAEQILSDKGLIDITRGLIAYWPMDGESGKKVENVIGKNGDIFGFRGDALVYGENRVKGRFGNAMLFTGQKTMLEVNKIADFDCKKSLSISVWIMMQDQKERGIIINHENAYRLCVNQNEDNKIRFQLNLDGKWAANWLTSKSAVIPGKWYHIAAVYSGKKRSIFLNGILDAEEEISGEIGNGGNFTIGGSRIDPRVKRRVETSSEQNTYTVMEQFSGIIDEPAIWNRAISAEEIRNIIRLEKADFVKGASAGACLKFYPVTCAVMSGGKNKYDILIHNSSSEDFSGELMFLLKTLQEEIFNKKFTVNVKAGEKQLFSLPYTPNKSASLTLEIQQNSSMLFAMPLLSMEPCPKAVSRDLALKKIHDIACAGNYGPDDYCDDGSGKIVKSKIGDYREAGPKMFSRFVFRTPLNRTGLHLVRITYPDDKTRTCEIFSWSPLKADLYNAQTGYFSGRFLPISHRMQEHEYIIWAHHTDHAVVFTTWLSNEPAAAARIEVFEIEGRLPSSKLSGLETERLLGLYWEDPNSFPTCFGSEKPNLEDFDIVAKNLCDYLDYTGQNVLFHPAVGYDGPIYNSLIEPRGGMGGKYLPAAGHLDILINRFEERSLKLFPTFNVFSLNSLLSEMNADIEEIKKGKETFNVVDKDNVVYLKAWVHKHPTFNALQPWVQKKIKALVNELAERYGSSISFSGIAFHLNMPQPMYLGGLDSSYDDFTISWFERESGIIIPVDKKDPERFSRRYTWLINNKKEIWITWRCRKITDYYNELAEILKKQRSDLKLVIAFLEPPMPIIDEQSLEWQNGKSLYDSARETGIDPVMLAENPNIIFIKYMGPCDTHKRLTLLHRGKNLLAGLDIKTLRAIDFADEQLKKMRQTDLFGLYFQNRYFETDIGKKEPLKSSWFKSIEWRASAVVPAHDHFMEYYSRGLAVFDPMLITSGGFTTGTVGHEKKIKKFAEVYRLLPVGKWNEITNVHKNAVVRWLARDNKTYLYAVNSGYEKITISIPFKEKRIYTSLGNSPSLQTADSSFKAELGPYELAGWVSK